MRSSWGSARSRGRLVTRPTIPGTRAPSGLFFDGQLPSVPDLAEAEKLGQHGGRHEPSDAPVEVQPQGHGPPERQRNVVARHQDLLEPVAALELGERALGVVVDVRAVYEVGLALLFGEL